MPKMLPPSSTIWWVPASSVTNPEEELFKSTLYSGSGGAVDISCAVVTGYTLNPTDSDTDDTMSICDEGGVQTPVKSNYEASLTLFREAIGSSGKIGDTSVYDKAFKLFKDGTKGASLIEGYLVERIGWKQSSAVAEGQVLSAYKVVADNPRNVIGDSNTAIQMTVPFLPQGWFRQNKEVTDG